MSEQRGELALTTTGDPQGLIEEFSIMELEERLEFEAWCDNDTCVVVNMECPTNVPCDGQ